MGLQAFIDDSYDKDGVYVLAGCIAKTEDWVAFSTEWEKMLPDWGVLNKNGKYHFHMTEMTTKERLARVPTFLATIEKYILGYVSVKINITELKRAKARLIVPGKSIDWTEYDPFYITFRSLIDGFHLNREKMTEAFGDEKIDFYFDSQIQEKQILAMWNNYINNRPDDLKKYYGKTPRFADDGDFLPLQAADLLAWWARKMHAEGTPEKIRFLDFGEFKPNRKRKMLKFDSTHNEEQLVAELKKVIRTQLGSSHIIYDSGNFSLVHPVKS